MELDSIERVEARFKQRYRLKKLVNLFISVVIALSGVLSVAYIWYYDGDGWLTFRWMTVDGTIFTTAIAFFFIAVNLYELARDTELTSDLVYYMRLSSSVAEGMILTVVLLSQLPFSPQHMHIARFDMFQMHVLIPALSILSFLFNDFPIGRLTTWRRFHGTWFVTLYAAVIITLILTGVIPDREIPYFFLDVAHMPALAFIGCFVFIYALGYLLSLCLSGGNRKLSWLWFRNVAEK